MNAYIPYIVFGLTAGSIYGISAMGLVLTYKTSGVFNIGHGATSAVSAYIFYELRQQHGWAWPLAAVVSILIVGPIIGLILERMAVFLQRVTVVNKIVATVGLLVCVQAGIGLIYGSSSGFFFKPFLPQTKAFSIQQVDVSYDNVFDLLFGIVLAVGLWVFFTRTRLGLQMRGVVDDPELLDMTGAAPAKVRRAAWMIGSTLAAVSGVLFAAAQQQLDINVLSLLVVQAFGAAAIARFTSLPLAFVGGLGVGVLQKLVSKEIAGHASLQGLDLNIPFIVLFVVLLVVPRRKLVEVGRHIKVSPLRPSSIPPNVRRIGFVALGVFALFLPHLGFVGAHLNAWNEGVSQVVLFLSLSLLVRTSGQISLCHIAFAAIGAAGFGHTVHAGVPWGIAVFIGGLCVLPVAALIAIPAIRLSGLYLGLATLGFGIFIAQYAYGKSFMFASGNLPTRRPDLWGLRNDTRFYYVLLAIALVALGLVLTIERSRLGRLLRGLADSPTGLVTLGVNLNVSRVLVFCISGFLAGISGATFASLFGSVSPDSFPYVQSLLVLAVLAISGKRTVTAAVVGPLLLFVVPNYINDPKLNYLLQFGFGLFAIIAAASSSGGIAKFFAVQGLRASDRLIGPADDRVDRFRQRQVRAAGRGRSTVRLTDRHSPTEPIHGAASLAKR